MWHGTPDMWHMVGVNILLISSLDLHKFYDLSTIFSEIVKKHLFIYLNFDHKKSLPIFLTDPVFPGLFYKKFCH